MYSFNFNLRTRHPHCSVPFGPGASYYIVVGMSSPLTLPNTASVTVSASCSTSVSCSTPSTYLSISGLPSSLSWFNGLYQIDIVTPITNGRLTWEKQVSVLWMVSVLCIPYVHIVFVCTHTQSWSQRSYDDISENSRVLYVHQVSVLMTDLFLAIARSPLKTGSGKRPPPHPSPVGFRQLAVGSWIHHVARRGLV